jgi:hypothetical protein
MKPFLTILILAGSFCSIPAEGRTLRDINVISPRVLKRSVSPKFFKSLLISPVDGWIVVRANLVKNRLMGARVLRSELGETEPMRSVELDEVTLVIRAGRARRQRAAAPACQRLTAGSPPGWRR